MSLLTETLEKLMDYLNLHMPEYASSFLPGLSSEEIYKMLDSIGLYCPPEIIELYQWRNGTYEQVDFIGYPPEFNFTPLEKTIEIYEEYKSDDNLAIFQTMFEETNSLQEIGVDICYRLFPFLYHQGDIYSISASPDINYIFYDHVEDGCPSLAFDNLTSMMQTLLLFYEKIFIIVGIARVI